MQSLPLFHVLVGRPTIVVGEGPAGEARKRLIERAGGSVRGEADPDARLAFVALADRGEAEAAAARLRARGVLVNVADRPELCDFLVPAIVDRDPVLVAVGTGGASAGLAKWLRVRLETLLPEGLGRLARGLAEAREAMRARWPEAGERRRALDAALTGGPLDPLRSGSAERIGGWLAGAASAGGAGCVEIALRSDDPEDLTLREARLLGCADLVLHEAGAAAPILARARADAVRRRLDEAAPGEGLTVIVRNPPRETATGIRPPA